MIQRTEAPYEDSRALDSVQTRDGIFLVSLGEKHIPYTLRLLLHKLIKLHVRRTVTTITTKFHFRIQKSTSDLGNSSYPSSNITINIVVNIANVIDFKTFYVR